MSTKTGKIPLLSLFNFELRKLSAKFVGLLQILALTSDGSFFAYAGDDNLAEKFYFQIRQGLLKEFDNTPSRLRIVFLERDGQDC